jgi:hypothetical protein
VITLVARIMYPKPLSEVRLEIELEGSPDAGCQLSQELAIVAEEDPQPPGDREDHLAVGDILEQLTLGPVDPQKLPLLMAARAQTPKLAREGDEKLVTTVRAAHPGDTLVEDAAVEIAVDRRLDAASPRVTRSSSVRSSSWFCRESSPAPPVSIPTRSASVFWWSASFSSAVSCST